MTVEDSRQNRQNQSVISWAKRAAKTPPPHHYDLVGIPLYESDPKVIRRAIDLRRRQVTRLKQSESAYVDAASKRLQKAEVCLLDSDRKGIYDNQLRAMIGASATPLEPVSADDDLELDLPPQLADFATKKLTAATAQNTPTIKISGKRLGTSIAILASLIVLAFLATQLVRYVSKASVREIADAPVENRRTRPELPKAPPKEAKPPSSSIPILPPQEEPAPKNPFVEFPVAVDLPTKAAGQDLGEIGRFSSPVADCSKFSLRLGDNFEIEPRQPQQAKQTEWLVYVGGPIAAAKKSPIGRLVCQPNALSFQWSKRSKSAAAQNLRNANLLIGYEGFQHQVALRSPQVAAALSFRFEKPVHQYAYSVEGLPQDDKLLLVVFPVQYAPANTPQVGAPQTARIGKKATILIGQTPALEVEFLFKRDGDELEVQTTYWYSLGKERRRLSRNTLSKSEKNVVRSIEKAQKSIAAAKLTITNLERNWNELRNTPFRTPDQQLAIELQVAELQKQGVKQRKILLDKTENLNNSNEYIAGMQKLVGLIESLEGQSSIHFQITANSIPVVVVGSPTGEFATRVDRCPLELITFRQHRGSPS